MLNLMLMAELAGRGAKIAVPAETFSMPYDAQAVLVRVPDDVLPGSGARSAGQYRPKVMIEGPCKIEVFVVPQSERVTIHWSEPSTNQKSAAGPPPRMFFLPVRSDMQPVWGQNGVVGEPKVPFVTMDPVKGLQLRFSSGDPITQLVVIYDASWPAPTLLQRPASGSTVTVGL